MEAASAVESHKKVSFTGFAEGFEAQAFIFSEFAVRVSTIAGGSACVRGFDHVSGGEVLSDVGPGVRGGGHGGQKGVRKRGRGRREIGRRDQGGSAKGGEEGRDWRRGNRILERGREGRGLEGRDQEGSAKGVRRGGIGGEGIEFWRGEGKEGDRLKGKRRRRYKKGKDNEKEMQMIKRRFRNCFDGWSRDT